MDVFSFHSELKYGVMYLCTCFSFAVLSSVLHCNCKEINIDFRLKQTPASSEDFQVLFVILKTEICVHGKTALWLRHRRKRTVFEELIMPIIKRKAFIYTHFLQDSLLMHLTWI